MWHMMKVMILKTIKFILGLYNYFLFFIKSFFLSDEKLLETNTHLIYLRVPDFSIEKCINIKTMIEQKAVKRIRGNNTIRVGFVVYTESIWFFDELYALLYNNPKFEPFIVVGHFKMGDSDREYKKTYKFFMEKGYRILSVNELCKYDALFYLTPFELCEEELKLKNLSLTHLVFHASYSYMLSGNLSKLNMTMYHWSFRYYTDTQYYLDLIKKSIKKYSGNSRYFGNPKMDQYYRAECSWLSEKITIIYAPHHSVDYIDFKAATFEDNYKFILEMMKKYKDKVYWIYKPHPLLRSKCIKEHIFETYDDYDAYLEEMTATGCVKIADSGDYFGLFKASDAMITDSVSFLAEYQFTGKPLLLLMSGQEKYNDFGQSIVDILYTCPGKDFAAIEAFLEKIIHGEDPMKEKRQAFFDNNLDYIKSNGVSANRRIYEDLIEVFE